MRLHGLKSSSSSRSHSAANAENDLGFGNKFTAQQGRLIRSDGSFNVERTGNKGWTPYQELIEMTWPRFFLIMMIAYYLINIFFAILFILCGDDGFSGLHYENGIALFLELFFFSVQTFTTVGYGTISPVGFIANFIATLNAFAGLLAFALATGLLFARFARPKAQILFSKNALIAPYQKGKSFQFRIVNRRSNNIINLNAKVAMSWIEKDEAGNPNRKFAPMELERAGVALFPLNWTIVHPIDLNSPLYQLSCKDLQAMQAEFIILIEGYDETFAHNVHANRSYAAIEIQENARFAPMYFPGQQTTLLKLDDISRILEEE